MTKEERRAFEALMAYNERFGDGSFPGVDCLPPGYDDPEKIVPLLEKCVAEGKEIGAYVEVMEYDPKLLY